jgi:cell wall-associated NlpC family hydrolase
MKHWSIKYLGLPWSPDCDCWGFFCLVQREQFGRDLPVIPLADYRLRAKSAVIAGHPERANWREIPADEAQEGDGLLMVTGRLDAHVGIWIDVDGGRVLHSDDPLGGMATPLDRMADQYTQIKFYRYQGAACRC